MIKFYKTLFLVMWSIVAMGQARLVLNNNPFIVLNGGSAGTKINLVIGNPAANAITLATAQTYGGIATESEYNIVKWNVSNTTGTYTVPFTKPNTGTPANSNPATVSVVIGTAGSAGGSILFSTQPAATWDNSASKPSFITNFNSATAGGDNSDRVIDRYWIVDAGTYGTKPVGTLTFNYVDAEHAAPNDILEANLKAQRYKASANNWDGYAIQGTQANGAGNFGGNVSGVTFSDTDFEKGWTLVDTRSALPIELTEFKADCENGQRNVYWTTATETNNEYFTIEKSMDGSVFTEIATVVSLAPSGNSSSKLHYNYIDKNNIPGNYYRLKQTDYDGKFEYSAIIFNKCDDDASKPNSADIFPNPSNGVIHVLLTGYENQAVQIRIMNAMGQQVVERSIQGDNTTQKETFSLTEQAKGIYYVTIITEKETITKKVINQY